MTQKWLDAAQRYERAKKVVEEQKLVETPQEMMSTEDGRLRLQSEIAKVARELDQFVKSEEGRAAMALLKASGRWVNFGEERESGYAEVFFIDGNGLFRSVEASGESWIYSREKAPAPKITASTAQAMIEAAAYHEKRKPAEVLNWLRGELDKIANTAK